ncbi:hypothetical protein KR215_012147 [Drosophila sulfurigaster]|nr:hypothetical protein KR215_012147 [Drosophila sulfurigaster]
MNPKTSLIWPLIVALACLQLGVHSLPVKKRKQETRSLLPLVFLVGSSKVNVNVANTDSTESALRRQQQQYDDTREQNLVADALSQNAAQIEEALIRQQFLQSLAESLSGNNLDNNGATISEAALLDLLAQSQNRGAIEVNDGEYDYIDFNKGSRIKYDFVNNEQAFNYAPTTNNILRVRPASQIGYLIPS